MARSMTATSTSSLNSPSGRPGVKRVLDDLCRQVADHTRELEELERKSHEKSNDFDGLLAAMEARLNKHIEDVRAELRSSVKGLKGEIEQVKEHIAALSGSQGVLEQQSKDSHKRIQEIGSQLHQLNVEILGD